MNATSRLRPLVGGRLPSSLSTVGVLGGDMLVVFAFIATGQASHGYFFWEAPVRTVLITIPFVLAWLLVAVPMGLFVHKRMCEYRGLVFRVVVAWIGASLLGGLIRATALFPGRAPAGFLAATIGFGILFFVPWRLVVAWQFRRRG